MFALNIYYVSTYTLKFLAIVKYFKLEKKKKRKRLIFDVQVTVHRDKFL